MILQQGHSQRSDSLVFSPDNRYLASASADSTIRIWDAATGNELRVLKGHVTPVRSVAFSVDGKLLASGGADGKVKLWDAASGKELASFNAHAGRVNALAFSRDNTLLASGGIDNAIKLWNVAAKIETRTLAGHAGWVTALAFGADNLLASGSADKTIRLWNAATGQSLQTREAHNQPVTCLAFNAKGDALASGGADAAVRAWTLPQFNGSPVFSLGAGRIVALSFNNDGNQLMAASSERIIKRYDLATRRELLSLSETERTEKYEAAAFSSDSSSNGQHIAISTGTRDLEVRSFDDFNAPIMLTSRANPIRAIAFSNDGRWMATGNQDTSTTLWDVFAGRAIANIAGNEGSIVSVAFSADSQLLATGSRGGIVRLIEVVGAREVRRWQAHGDGVNAMQFTSDGKLVTGSSDQSIKVWDASGNAIGALKQTKEINSLCLSNDGKLLAAGLADGSIKIFDAANWQELRSLAAHSGAVFALSFNNDGKLLASGGVDQTIKLWQTGDWQTVRSINASASTYSLLFSPDDKLLAAGSAEGVVKLLDAANGSTRATLTGASGSANGLSFSDNGNWLTSAHDDGSARIWSTATGQLTATALSLRESNDWLVVTPEGLFDGSPAAWPQILWRFGQNTFTTAPVEIFFNEFFHPDLLADVLAGKRPQPKEGIAQIDRRQPRVQMLLGNETTVSAKPVINAQRTIGVKIEVADAGSGAQDVRLFRNGMLFKVWRGDALKGRASAIIETQAPIIAGENRLTAYAFNRDNVKSLDANRSVIGADNLRKRGTAYILAIGVNRYSNPSFNLNFAVSDATDFSQELQRRQTALNRFANVQQISLFDQQATKANIVAAIEKLKTTQPEDAVIVYFAGHGLAAEPRFYLIPHDLGFTGKRENLTQAGVNQVLRNSISDEELTSLFEGIGAGQLLMVIDACNSGQVLEAEETRRGPMNSKGLAQLAYEKGISVLTASQSYQAALENKELGHGYLTYALIEDGLRKMAADNGPRDGRVLLREWFDHATAKVPRLQEQKYQAERERILRRKNASQLKGKVKPELQRPRLFYRRETDAQPMVITGTPAPSLRN
ncbi:MAG: caspase family protein [Blastocatellia bacterium]